MKRREKLISIPVILILALVPCVQAVAQSDSTYEQKYEAAYQQRIQKSHLNGIYIPEDLQDAFRQLEKISSIEGLQKFISADEQTVSQRLHFGLGKWMVINWQFYDGSRFSHFLKQKGLAHPDDMAQFVIISFHRNLNGRELQEEALIGELVKRRQQEYERNVHRDTIPKGP